MKSIIPVNLPNNSYEIQIASNSLTKLGEAVKKLGLGKKIMVVSNAEIFNFYGDTVINSLKDEGFEVNHHLIIAGESYKNFQSLQAIYDSALQYKLERTSTLLALGGGVVGDMTGFAAATWLRGINFIQVPTSLLAMVDASIGGKTGINHPQGKNLIGAFYQPKLVFIDPLVLKTLPIREFQAGMAEVIKYGVIWDANLFTQLENASRLDSLEFTGIDLLHSILLSSCQAKAQVVSQDEKEGGLRAILNYGHTIGHALESCTNYDIFVHGEAVAIGMIEAGKIAVMSNLWSEKEAQRQQNLIEKVGLPTEIPSNVDKEKIIALLQSDKKVIDGKVRFILPQTIGKVVISDQVSSELLRKIFHLT